MRTTPAVKSQMDRSEFAGKRLPQKITTAAKKKEEKPKQPSTVKKSSTRKAVADKPAEAKAPKPRYDPPPQRAGKSNFLHRLQNEQKSKCCHLLPILQRIKRMNWYWQSHANRGSAEVKQNERVIQSRNGKFPKNPAPEVLLQADLKAPLFQHLEVTKKLSEPKEVPAVRRTERMHMSWEEGIALLSKNKKGGQTFPKATRIPQPVKSQPKKAPIARPLMGKEKLAMEKAKGPTQHAAASLVRNSAKREEVSDIIARQVASPSASEATSRAESIFDSACGTPCSATTLPYSPAHSHIQNLNNGEKKESAVELPNKKVEHPAAQKMTVPAIAYSFSRSDSQVRNNGEKIESVVGFPQKKVEHPARQKKAAPAVASKAKTAVSSTCKKVQKPIVKKVNKGAIPVWAQSVFSSPLAQSYYRLPMYSISAADRQKLKREVPATESDSKDGSSNTTGADSSEPDVPQSIIGMKRSRSADDDLMEEKPRAVKKAKVLAEKDGNIRKTAPQDSSTSALNTDAPKTLVEKTPKQESEVVEQQVTESADSMDTDEEALDLSLEAVSSESEEKDLKDVAESVSSEFSAVAPIEPEQEQAADDASDAIPNALETPPAELVEEKTDVVAETFPSDALEPACSEASVEKAPEDGVEAAASNEEKTVMDDDDLSSLFGDDEEEPTLSDADVESLFAEEETEVVEQPEQQAKTMVDEPEATPVEEESDEPVAEDDIREELAFDAFALFNHEAEEEEDDMSLDDQFNAAFDEEEESEEE
ncbi:hypothetical protein BJ508DRAFT_302388 [Ascobolus immersus RN42]|uniref:Uncharacterized protein n=1 Tax=Ascobolus immersus RN42 TaxID=1160509 RepID=A0A3N4IJK1_ASCIM|nr:hypothetical protein BJ508DRAFT_302388 [Ascobolus immersus RN42]